MLWDGHSVLLINLASPELWTNPDLDDDDDDDDDGKACFSTNHLWWLSWTHLICFCENVSNPWHIWNKTNGPSSSIGDSIWDSTYCYTLRQRRNGCNSFGTICVCLCLCVSLSRMNGHSWHHFTSWRHVFKLFDDFRVRIHAYSTSVWNFYWLREMTSQQKPLISSDSPLILMIYPQTPPLVIFMWFSFSFLQLVAYCGTVLIQLILLLPHTKCTNWTSCIKSCTKCGIVDGLAQVMY